MSSPVYIAADDLIKALGLVAALKLVENLGGTSIYVPNPEKLRAEHPLVKAVGVDGARMLAAEWRHLDVTLPRCVEELRKRRNRALRSDAGSMSVRLLALKYDMTERNVYLVLAARAEDDADDAAAAAQPQLFD